MNKEKLRIVFSGTPEFASICLEQLISDGFNIVAVITAPDRKKGRGQQLAMSAVKELALKNKIEVLQPTNLKDEEFLNKLTSFHADLGVVVAFRMLPERVWNMPKLGTINLHASLLPDYRGAAPINWVLINGEKKTGITTFFLKHEIDTGDVVHQEAVEISKNSNAGELHDILASKGAKLLSKTIDEIENGSVKKIPQVEMAEGSVSLKKAPKIFKEDGKIDWNQSSQIIFNKVRGLSPYPTAWSEIVIKEQNRKIKIFECSISEQSSEGSVGKVITENNHQLLIGSKDYYISIKQLQIEGKGKMDVASFLRGTNLDQATINS